MSLELIFTLILHIILDELEHSIQEAIAGKCNVLCISKDKENPQPSDEELQKADFVFYRTFDVSQQKIMDKIEGKIADVDGTLTCQP